MNGLLNFSNSLAGALSLIAWAILVARAVQLFQTSPDLNATIVPPKRGHLSATKSDRIWLLIMVGLLLLCEFAIDARTVWSRHFNDWPDTREIAIISWFGKSFATLAIARQFSVSRCGEKGWFAMLIVAVLVSLILL